MHGQVHACYKVIDCLVWVEFDEAELSLYASNGEHLGVPLLDGGQFRFQTASVIVEKVKSLAGLN